MNPASPPPSRQLARLRDRWERFGREDPVWAVLANPVKRGGRWNVDEFFTAAGWEGLLYVTAKPPAA